MKFKEIQRRIDGGEKPIVTIIDYYEKMEGSRLIGYGRVTIMFSEGKKQ